MTPRPDLHGRTAVVTGAARGIGRAIAQRLIADGVRIALWDRDHARLESTRRDLSGAGDVHAFVTDQRDLESVDAAARATLDSLGRIDILVNNAAIPGPQHPVWEFPPERWREVVEIDLFGQFYCCRAVVPHMLAAGYGRIVNMSSLAGKEGHANFSAYAVAKAGIVALTKCLAREVATRGITVNCVLPGTIETESLAEVPEEFHRAILARTPMARFGRPEEVAAMVCWLAGDEASFTTGAVFDISGGRTGYQ